MIKKENKNLERIEQIRKECLSKLPEKTVRLLEVVDRDCRIIEKIIEKRIHPKSIFDLAHDEHGKLFMEELHKFNQKLGPPHENFKDVQKGDILKTSHKTPPFVSKHYCKPTKPTQPTLPGFEDLPEDKT